MFGKLSWQAIPFDQPIPLAAARSWFSFDRRRVDLGVGQGLHPLPLARVDHERRSQAHRHHVLRACAGVMLLRGFIDA